MKKIEISYNPYKMITTMKIDGIDVSDNRVYHDEDHKKIGQFINQGTPLQTWIEPIKYLDWPGLLAEITDPERNDKLRIVFSGRKIDFDDLKRSLNDQNDDRSEETKIIFEFVHDIKLDDKELSKNIDEVVKDLKSDKFRSLVERRTTAGLREKYDALEENYNIVKENEFYIVFAGIYSSGKSTLLNTIIRHEALPTSSKTCTSKNCKIKHDASLEANQISLTCYDENDKVVVAKEIFDNDTDCAERFEEISPTGKTNEKYSSVETIVLGMDLSHLYPESVDKDKFTLVLIDTPGMNSAQTSDDGVNKHAEIALEAVSSDSKPMIILCAEATQYEDESIGEFMKEIISQSKEDGGGFNDRFLFIMNKSDDIDYNNDEEATDVKSDFSKYLTNSDKWSISGDPELEKLAESADDFVPRVFMTAARMAFAIQKGAHDFTKEEKRADGEKRSLAKALEGFEEEIFEYENEKYYLSRYCDIPNYLKDEIEAEFEKAMEEEDSIRATELQCGIIPVEMAIRDYIEKYAYPVKVRGLLDTFEDILEDVENFSSDALNDIKNAMDHLGEMKDERGGAIERKKSIEEKKVTLEKAQKQAESELQKLNNINFDTKSLNRATGEFRADIEDDETIIFIRNNREVKTNGRSSDAVDKEIKELVSKTENVFNKAYTKIGNKLQEIKKIHDGQILEIFRILEKIVSDLEKSGVFDQGEYKFSNSVLWNTTFRNLNSDKFISEIMETKSESTKYVTVRNREKDYYRSKGWFGRFRALFMKSTVTELRTVVDSYSTEALQQNIADHLYELKVSSNNLEKEFKDMLEKSKSTVRRMITALIAELNAFHKDIEEQANRIESLSDDIDKLHEEIAKQEEIGKWLEKLKDKIKGV